MRFKTTLLIVLLLSLGTATVHGQQIKLNIITFNPCDSTFDNELLVHIVKGDKKYFISDSLGTINLPETGVYKLRVFDNSFYRLPDSVKFITINSGQNYDTLTRSTIMKGVSVNCVLPPQGPGWGYLCCDNLCEGYNVDFFDNGKKKMEGHFKSGLPIGQLTFYNADGKVTEIHHYDKAGKGRLKKEEKLP
jgi:hypothetical protein